MRGFFIPSLELARPATGIKDIVGFADSGLLCGRPTPLADFRTERGNQSRPDRNIIPQSFVDQMIEVFLLHLFLTISKKDQYLL